MSRVMQPQLFHERQAANPGISGHVIGQVEQFVVGVIPQRHREEQVADVGRNPRSTAGTPLGIPDTPTNNARLNGGNRIAARSRIPSNSIHSLVK